jgi:hypothetical protein
MPAAGVCAAHRIFSSGRSLSAGQPLPTANPGRPLVNHFGVQTLNLHRSLLRPGATVLALALLGACATQNQPGAGPISGQAASSTAAPDELVRERAEARWQALVERRFSDAYTYLSPGYRELTTVNDYVAAMSNRPVRWESADVTDATCDADVCQVKVLMTYSLTMPQAGVGRINSVSGINEQWLKLDGEWFHLPEDS